MQRRPSAINSKGQVTIPKTIRDRLGLEPGSRVKFFVHPNGSIVLMAVRPVTALRGIVGRPLHTVSIDDMNEAVKAGATNGFERGKKR